MAKKATFWRDSVITYFPKSHNRKKSNKRLAKRKISHHKKENKEKEKNEAAENEFKKGGKKQKPQTHCSLLLLCSVFVGVAFSTDTERKKSLEVHPPPPPAAPVAVPLLSVFVADIRTLCFGNQQRRRHAHLCYCTQPMLLLLGN